MQKPLTRRIITKRPDESEANERLHRNMNTTPMGRVANKEVKAFNHTRSDNEPPKEYEAIRGPANAVPAAPLSSEVVRSEGTLVTRNRPALRSPRATVVARPASTSSNTGSSRKLSQFSERAAPTGNQSLKIFVTFQVSPDVETDNASPLLNALTSVEIAVMQNDGEVEYLTFGTEGEAIKKLLELINSCENPQVITYLGRQYLFPRVQVVALRDKIKRGLFAATGNRYASFQTRFNPLYHLDISDTLSNFGAVECPSLSDIYRAITGEQGCQREVESLIAIYKALKETE